MTMAIENVLKWFDDRLNPVLVKEVRQALNGREFILTFMFMMILALAITGMILGLEAADLLRQARSEFDARPVFMVVLGCLAFASILMVPVMAYRSFDQERNERCYDLLIITTCGPGSIVRGKIFSALIQLVLFFSASLPFLAAIYLIGNIDLAGMAVGLVWLFLASIFLCMVSLLAAACASRTKRRSSAFVMNVIFLLLVFLGSFSGLTVVVYGDISSQVHDWRFWLINAEMVTIFVSMTLLLYAGIRALSLFETANRSTYVRLALLLNWIVISAWRIVYAAGGIGMRPGGDGWTAYGNLTINLFWLYAFFAAAESDTLSRRVMTDYPTGFFKRLYAAFFYPGSARGFFFTVFLAFFTLLIIGFWGGFAEDSFVTSAMFACYMAGYIGIPLAIMRRRSIEKLINPPTRGVIIFAITIAGILLPSIGMAFVAGRLIDRTPLMYIFSLSPVGGATFYYDSFWQPFELLLVPGAMGAIGLLLNIRPFMKAAAFRKDIPPPLPPAVSDAGAAP